MRRLFTMMWNQVQATAELLKHWWLTLSIDPSTWVPFTWVLAAALAVIVLLLAARPRRRPSRRPELLISHGELRVTEDAEAASTSLLAPERGSFELSMIVSNLSAVPVQLLELAVRTNASAAPTTAEVPAVLPPHGAVEVRADLREAGGDEGTLELFVYAPDMPPKTFRLRAKLLWEPWNTRFRVLPLDQKVDVARGFGQRSGVAPTSSRRQRRAAVDRRAYRARFPEAAAEEEEVRFQPRPESARPRASAWPEPAERGGAAAGRREPDVASSWDEPSGSGATWPPRRPASWSGEAAPAPESAPPGREGPGAAPGTAPRPAAGAGGGSGSGEELLEIDDVAAVPETEGYRRPARREIERGDAERRGRERREMERREAERLAAERRERERRERERRDAARRAAERAETERREAARLQRERAERERAEQERAERERGERERAEQERAEQERAERERREAQRLAAERRERKRRESASGEASRVEAERSRIARPGSGAPQAAPNAGPRGAAGPGPVEQSGRRPAGEEVPPREDGASGAAARSARAQAPQAHPVQPDETYRSPAGPGRGRGQRARSRRDAAAEGGPDAGSPDEGDALAPGHDRPERTREGASGEREGGEGAGREDAQRGRERHDTGSQGIETAKDTADETGADTTDETTEAPRRPRLEFPDEF